MAPVIAATGLHKRYGGVQALRGVDIAVAAGEVVAIVGENGAGKSTLVKALSGVIEPDAGEIAVDGVPHRLSSPRVAQAVGIRIAAQELQLAVDVSVTENLLMGQLPTRGWLGTVDWAAAHDLAEQRLARLGVHHVDVTQSIRTLSVVDSAFVQIARAMSEETRVLILDEPTAPMDATEVTQLLEVIRTVSATGIAVLYISHRLPEIFAICHRAVVLRDGEIVAEFGVDEMTTERLVEAMVSGRMREFDVPDRPVGDGGFGLEAHGVRGRVITIDHLTVAHGEVVSVYGSLGSGREEVAPSLLGLTGSVADLTVQGRSIGRVTTPAVIDAGVGYVPAERRSEGLVLERSVAENLTLGMLGQLSNLGVVDRRRDAEIVATWIASLDIATDSPETPVQALSGGSQQKVLLSRWLAAGKQVLVLEEPTRGVDVATKAEIYRTLHQHAARGGCVLIVSSDIEEVARVSHRVLVMRDGGIVAELHGAEEADIAARAMAA